MTTALSPATAATATTAATGASTAGTRDASPNEAANAQDRFLKLLVAQLNNQDPMNPLDNAQMTSQIAQINTVTGIQQLNETVKGLVGQFASQQLMQGSALVGRQVLVQGNALAFDAETSKGYGALDLDSGAASVQVQVLDASDKEVGVVDLGALPGGRHHFEWNGSGHAGGGALHFKVLAANDKTPVPATALMVDQVAAVSLGSSGALQLELARGGTVGYGAVQSIL